MAGSTAGGRACSAGPAASQWALWRDPWVVTLAMVHLGYLASAFIHVYDGRSRRFVQERTVSRTPLALRFGDLEEHRYARFISRPLSRTVKRANANDATEPMVVSAKTSGAVGIELDASLDPLTGKRCGLWHCGALARSDKVRPQPSACHPCSLRLDNNQQVSGIDLLRLRNR